MKKKKLIIKKIIYILFIGLLGYLLANLAGVIYQNRPQLEEHTWQGYINWGDNLAYYGDYELAVKAVETAISKEPQNAEGYVFLADIYMRSRDIESAKKVYADAAEKLGENKLFEEGLAQIANIDLPVDTEKSIDVSKTSEDTPKYDTTRKYNSNGDIVYSFARSRDWERPDVETYYEYNSDNQLLKVTELSSYAVPSYTTYTYHPNGQVSEKNICDFDGFILNKTVYDQDGVKTRNDVHSTDKSYYVEHIDADEYVYRKEFYNTDEQLAYYAEYEMVDAEEYDEITKYYNADNTLKYTVLHKYSSAIKSVQRETYLNADGTVAYIVDHGTNKQYYLYTDEESLNTDGGEYTSSKFYSEIDEYVHQQLGVLK